MATVPQAYYDFIKENAPYVYVIPGSGPDPSWGRAAFAAAFAIDFLYETYSDPQFLSKQTDIYNKIVSLADWILTQQRARYDYGSLPFAVPALSVPLVDGNLFYG